MTLRIMTFTLLLIGGLVSTHEAQAWHTPDERHAIKAMPIQERPSRPGHFYGNTVRRNFERSQSRWPVGLE